MSSNKRRASGINQFVAECHPVHAKYLMHAVTQRYTELFRSLRSKLIINGQYMHHGLSLLAICPFGDWYYSALLIR